MNRKEYNRLAKKLENDSAIMMLRVGDDSVLLTAQPTSLAELGLKADAEGQQ